MSKSAPQPRSRKTPRGGRMMAKMILIMSLERKCQTHDLFESAPQVLAVAPDTLAAREGTGTFFQLTMR